LGLAQQSLFTVEFGGGRWVGPESPVSSIDPVVTQAVINFR
jgi:hypothetical protein